MRFLLDSHTLLWAIQNRAKLSSAARETLISPDHEV